MKENTNTFLLNLAMLFTLFVSTVLGLINLVKAMSNALSFSYDLEGMTLLVIFSISFMVVLVAIRKARQANS